MFFLFTLGDINYCGLFMCLPNPSGDKHWTLFNETQLKTLPTQLAISCNFNKNIKFCWSIAVCLWPSSNLGGNSCFSFLFYQCPLHVGVPWVLEGLSDSKRESKGQKLLLWVHAQIAQCLFSSGPFIICIILRPTVIKVWPLLLYFGIFVWLPEISSEENEVCHLWQIYLWTRNFTDAA